MSSIPLDEGLRKPLRESLRTGPARRDWLKWAVSGLATPLIAAAPGASAPAPTRAGAAGPAVAGLSGITLMDSCRASLTIGARRADGAELVRIGEWCRREGADGDVYGHGGLCERFEKRVAALLGYEAACFMPTGTMGQLILLRLHAERSNVRTIGLHPSSHHVLHEEDSLGVLHGLRSRPLSPWRRALRADDVRDTDEPLGAISVELPVRWTGQLQTWSELQALKDLCHERKIPLHMDGARLWDCQPYYGRSLAEICRGFDSVYVSFYKTIGALGGALIAGPAPLIAQARTWRRRHGGDLFQLFPYVASAAMRLDSALERIPTWVARAQTLAQRIARLPQVTVGPSPVPTSLFRLYLRGDPQQLSSKRDTIARERGIWVTHGFERSRVPGFVETELHIAAGIDPLTDDEAARAVEALVT